MDYELGYFDMDTCRVEPRITSLPKNCIPCARCNLYTISPVYILFYMAGTGGVEPPTYDTKNRCSTTELRPNRIDWQFIAIFT